MTADIVFVIKDDFTVGYRAATVEKPDDVPAITFALANSKPGWHTEVNPFGKPDSLVSWDERDSGFYVRRQLAAEAEVSGNTDPDSTPTEQKG